MHDPVTFAVPFFLLLLIIEWAAARKLAHTEAEQAPAGAYLRPDAWASISIDLIYQFWIHTERIGKLWRPIEFIFNTASHHRVHHGMDQQYLDKNYGGIFILWDRLFGSFQAETTRPHYGLTKQVDTFNIWKLQTHEYVAIARDVRRATRWRDRLSYIFRPPGSEPADGRVPVVVE